MLSRLKDGASALRPFWSLVMVALDVLVIWALARQIGAESGVAR
ncbi:DUF7144 family membrane protein [Nocardia vinacea]